MIILVVVALALAVMAYVSYPLWASRAKTVGRPAGAPVRSAASKPVRQREDAPSDAGELDLDRQAGRLDEQEYTVLMEGVRASGKASPGEVLPDGASLQAEDDEIERRVRALRQERARQRSQPKSKTQERK